MKLRNFLLIILGITIIYLSTLNPVVNADETITVKGTIKVHDQAGNLVPAKNAKVKIYDEESYYAFGVWVRLPWPDEYIKTVYTNGNGYFSTSINNDDGSTILGDENGRDIYLIIESENTHAKVTKGPSWRPLKGIFKHQTGTQKEKTSDADFGTFTISGEVGVALDILTHVDQAWKFVRDKAGISLPKANVYYKDGLLTTGSSYCFPDSIGAIILDPIQVGDLPLWLQLYPFPTWSLTAINELAGLHLNEDHMNGERRYEIIYHEYGHFVMDKIGDFYPPWTELLHDPLTPYWEEHAFQEGFAEFFSAAARDHYGIVDSLKLGSSLDIETIAPIGPIDRAAEIEFNVAAALWDIYDDKVEPWDESNLGFNTIVNTIVYYDPDPSEDWFYGKDHPWTIYDFFEGYMSFHPDDPSISQIWRILNHYNMVEGFEDTTPPTTPSGYTSSHNQYILIDDDTIDVNLLGITDDLSGVSLIYYYFTTMSDTGSDVPWKYSLSPQITSDPLDDGAWYLWVKSKDTAQNMGEIYVAGPFLVGENPFIEITGTIANINFVYAGYQTEAEITVEPKPSKLSYWEGPAFQIPYLMDDPELCIGTISLSSLELVDGPFQLKAIGIYEDENENEEEIIDLVYDATPPDIHLSLSGPNYSFDPTSVTRDTVFTVTATDTGIGLDKISYRFRETDEWTEYYNPIHPPALTDGSYAFTVTATDLLGNEDTLTYDVLLDNSGPEIIIRSPVPDSHISGVITFQSSMGDASGIDSVLYAVRVSSSPLDSIGYEGLSADNIGEYWSLIFNTNSLPDDEYILIVDALDILGNKESTSTYFVVDNSGPEIVINSPTPGSALQNGVTFQSTVDDVSGVEWVKYSIRAASSPLSSIGYDELTAGYSDGAWSLIIDSQDLVDGSYMVIVEASDTLGNTNEVTVEYSVRNWCTTELLPLTADNKAGRTMPIKFSLSVCSIVDPSNPFVHNEELVIEIWSNEELMATVTYGDTSRDYRIETSSHYITNFKTEKKPATYTVVIKSLDLQIGQFDFHTTR